MAVMKRAAAKARREHSEEAVFGKVKSNLEALTASAEDNTIRNGILYYQV